MHCKYCPKPGFAMLTMLMFLLLLPCGSQAAAGLVTTYSPAIYGTVTVTSPGVFEATFSGERGGSITSWYDLGNDPGKTTQFATSGGMMGWEYHWGSSYLLSTTLHGNIAILENTAARVKTKVSGTINNLPISATFTVYPSGLVSEKYEITNPTGSDASFTDARYHLTTPLSSGFSAVFDKDTSAPPQFGVDTWLQFLGNGSAGRKFSAVRYFISSNNYRYNQDGNCGAQCIVYRDNDGYTIPAGSAERIIWYTTLAPGASAMGTKAAVRAYEADFRSPASLSFTSGSAKTDDPEDANHDGFAEGEAAYTLAAAGNAAQFSLDGSSVARHSPVFKISDFTESAIDVTKDGAVSASSPPLTTPMTVMRRGGISPKTATAGMWEVRTLITATCSCL